MSGYELQYERYKINQMTQPTYIIITYNRMLETRDLTNNPACDERKVGKGSYSY